MSEDTAIATDFATAYRHAQERILKLAEADCELRTLIPSEAVSHAITRPGLADFEIVQALFDGYAARPALGRRKYSIVKGGIGRQARCYLPAFETITYAELGECVRGLANAWRDHPDHGLKRDDFVAILGHASLDYAMVDLACMYARQIVLPLQPNLPAEDLSAMLAEAGPRAIVTHIDHLSLAVEFVGRTPAKSIVVTDFDERDDAERLSLEDAMRKMAKLTPPVGVVTLDTLIAYGRQRRWSPPARHPDGDKRLAVVMYTSGSTGTPKGAKLSEYHCRSHCWGNVGRVPQITVSYAPFNHMQGRVGAYGTLAQGGTVFFTLKSDMSTLLEDIRIVRPTHFAFLPRIATLAYQHFQKQVQARQLNSDDDPKVIAREVMAEMKSSFLGNRLFFASLGSAPTSPEVKAFIAGCFGAAFAEGYGTTEAGVITVLDRIFRKNVVDYKLVDVAELGYCTTDKPFARGELLVKTKTLISGYFGHPELRETLFDADGFQRTGDIFEERGPDHVIWLDRKNNVLKLAQGEYVAIGALESAFSNATALIKQIYIYGNSYKSCLVAVVVPDIDVAMRRLGHAPSDEELAELIRGAFQEALQKASFRRFEVPRDFLIERTPFTYEDGLLSIAGKPLRPALKRKYAERLEALYEEIENNQQQRLAGLKACAGRISTADLLGKALETSLGLVKINAEAQQSFMAMGGDSLSAVSFALLLEDIFGVAVPVADILNPAASIRSWTKNIDRALGGKTETSQSLLTEITEQDCKIIHAKNLKLPLFLGEEFLHRAAAIPAAGISKTVLLTGANGFLGRALCMDLLEWAERNEGKVICLVRAPDARTGRARIEAALDTDAALIARFRLLAERHLQVMAGDLADHHFGLDDVQYERLCGQVDHIVHPASLVNHRLSFQHLFGPNVAGTAALIKLALSGRQKQFDYVSSVGVAMSGEDPEAGFETLDIRELKPSFAINDGYASGYIASKWASEVLLREAHAQFGLPVNVFRPSMILAHRNYRGQINAADIFSRLIYSVVLTGLAPRSFYHNADHSAAGHYDGLPVDLTSGFITGAGLKPASGFHTYNIVNTNYGDNVSLDRIIGWIASAGVKLDYIDTLPAWVARLERALRNLPEDQRQASALHILDAFRYPASACIKLPAGAFESVLRELPAGPHVPQLDERFVHKCLGDFRALGLW